MMLQYLDEYLDTIVSLPNDLQRHYSLLKQLESSSSSTLISSLTKHIDNVVKEGRTLPSSSSPKSSKMTLDEVKTALLRQIGIAQQRLAISKSAQASVEAHVQRLDDDLKHFEEEARLAGITLPRAHHAKTGATITGGSNANLPSVSTTGHLMSRKRKESGNKERHSNKKKLRRRQRGEEWAASEVSNPSDTPHALPRTQKKLSKKLRRTHHPPSPDGIYCFCEGPPQVTKSEAGEMVVHGMIACDYGRCPYEWFHLGCVGEKSADKDKPWYCPECRDKVSRRH
jgi:inhibitor of growth protein 5